MNKVLYFLIVAALFFCTKINGQEFNSKITINSDKIQGIDPEVFTSMQNSLTQLINERKWTDATFAPNERIECTYTLTLNSVTDGITYSGDLQISVRRPVYNSSYMTPTFIFRDTEVTFEYSQGESIEYTENTISSNLVAIFVYYTYITLGIDFDSFALNSGKPYFEKALNIVNEAQSLNVKGWGAFENDRNRYALTLALTEESSSRFHNMWYTYHRLGLDEMGTNIVRGRDKVIESLKDLEAVNSARPSSVLVLLFGDTKLDEFVAICLELKSDEKKEIYEVLRKLFPSKTTQINLLRN